MLNPEEFRADPEPERIEIRPWSPPEVQDEADEQYKRIKYVAPIFCSTSCREEYRQDRINGFEQPTQIVDGREISYNELCMKSSICCQCQHKLKS